MGLVGAVVGCGRMGAKSSTRLEGVIPSGWLPISHVESILSTKSIELSALSDISSATLKSTGGVYGISNLYVDYRELLSEVRPDILSIATRTPEKKDIILSAFENSVRGIYIEKPLSNSLADSLVILAKAREVGCHISYGVNRRYHQIYRKARDVLRQGTLGKLKEVSIEFGTSPLFWTHPHSMDLLLFFAGSPKTVRCYLDSETVQMVSASKMDSDPIIRDAYFTFENNVVGRITQGDGFSVRILCSEGSMTIHGDGAFIQLSTLPDDGAPYFLNQNYIHPCSPKGATVVAFEELASVISGELKREEFLSLISPKDIEYGMRMLLGCAWSHYCQNREVGLEDCPEDFWVTGRVGDLFA